MRVIFDIEFYEKEIFEYEIEEAKIETSLTIWFQKTRVNVKSAWLLLQKNPWDNKKHVDFYERECWF